MTLELDEQIRVVIDDSAMPVAAAEVISAHAKSSWGRRGPFVQPRTRRKVLRSAELLLAAGTIAVVGVLVFVAPANKHVIAPSSAPPASPKFPVSLSAPAQLRLLADRVADQDVQAVGERPAPSDAVADVRRSPRE